MVDVKNTHGEKKVKERLSSEKRVRRQERASEKPSKTRPRRRRKERRAVQEKKKHELKRLLSGSGTLFLAAYWLSLSAWLCGGGTAGSHWCHSPVNRPDRRTIGPRVVVRKLSVCQPVSSCIWHHLRSVWEHVCTNRAHDTKHTCWTVEITDHWLRPLLVHTLIHNFTPGASQPVMMPAPWLSSPPL